MKTKKFFLKSIILVLCVALLLVSLVACIKIGLKANNVTARLEKHGATVKTGMRSAPPIEGWATEPGVVVSNIIHATYLPEWPTDENGDGVEVEDASAYDQQVLYIIYADNKLSGDWVENACKAYISNEENADLTAHWNVYRSDNIILVGDYRLLAVARQY